MLGKGAFKTAHRADLVLHTSGIGAGLASLGAAGEQIPVALKRPFRPGAKGKILHFNVTEEADKVFIEANILCWATSLFSLAINFMSKAVARCRPDVPPFSIPTICFVYAGVALGLKDVNTNRSAVSSNRVVYLLEELLPPENEYAFQKYIHNNSAVPLAEPGEEGYETAKFLCCVQHVQYQLTGGLAYISDLQGGASLLTDPQIMTHPMLGYDLFGEGNLGNAFCLFSAQHQCNKFCQWFELLTPKDIAGSCEYPSQDETFSENMADEDIATGRRNDPIMIDPMTTDQER